MRRVAATTLLMLIVAAIHDSWIGRAVVPRLPPGVAETVGIWGVGRYQNSRIPDIQVSGTETVRDEFNVVSYGNNDGTQFWTGDWRETGDDGSASGGKIKIENDQLTISDKDRGIQRGADLSSATSAVLSFDYQRKDELGARYVTLEISADGGETWTELDRFTGPGTDETMLPASYDLSDYLAASTRVGFFTSPDLGKRELYVDNVQIEYDEGKTSLVYLPLIRHCWAWWHQYDAYEPNDAIDQAYGPMLSGQMYQAYIWNAQDQGDYYYFVSSTSSSVEISLINIPPGCDYDLYVYYYDGQHRLKAYSNRSGNADEDVAFTPSPGVKYYVRVYPYSGFSNQQSYYLYCVYQ